MSREQDKKLTKAVNRERKIIRITRSSPRDIRDKVDNISQIYGEDVNTLDDIKRLGLNVKTLQVLGFTKQDIVDNQLTSQWKRIRI